MADTAVLERMPARDPAARSERTEHDEVRGSAVGGSAALPSDEILQWSGGLPRRLVELIATSNPWDLRALTGVPVRYGEVNELVRTARLLHHILDRGPKRAAEGRWSFDDLVGFKMKVRRSIREMDRRYRQVADRARIFINSRNFPRPPRWSETHRVEGSADHEGGPRRA